MPRIRTDDGLLDGHPAAYFLTYTAYGTRIHGDSRGTVDKWHSLPGTPFLAADAPRLSRERELMAHPPMRFDTAHRRAIELAIREVARFRDWDLKALNVRTNHVHAVVDANATPERVMNDFKVWATKRLRGDGLSRPGRKVWSRHGSTIWLWTQRVWRPRVRTCLMDRETISRGSRTGNAVTLTACLRARLRAR